MNQHIRFVPKRECVCCRDAATPGAKRVEGEPNVMALSSTIYRRGTGKGQLKAAAKVRICADCFRVVVIERRFTAKIRTARLVAAVFDAWAACYSAMAAEEQKAA